MSEELKLREALARVKPEAWAITSNDRHWRREVRDQENRGIIWCGVCVDAEAHATAEFVAAANPGAIIALLAELDSLRSTQATPDEAEAGKDAIAAQAAGRAALTWCAAALQAAIPFGERDCSIRMIDTGDVKTIDEILDLANAALPPSAAPAAPLGGEKERKE